MHTRLSHGSHNGFKVLCALLLVFALVPSAAFASTTDEAAPSTGSSEVTADSTAEGTADAGATVETAADAAQKATAANTTSASQTTTPQAGESSSTSADASTSTVAATSPAVAASEPAASTGATSAPAAENASAKEAISLPERFDAFTDAPVLHTQSAADVALTITTDQTAYADGEYASFNVKYVLDYGKVKAGDTITITLPDVLKNASVAFSSLHFSACNNLGNGTYQLVFNDSAPTGLSGYFSINAFATNSTTTNQTGTVTVGDKSVTISVSPNGGGTSGTETRAIEKWAPDGTNYVQDTAITGVYSDGAVVRFAFEADPRCAAMKNVIVTDTLPDELEFVPDSIVIMKTLASDKTTTELTKAEAAQFIKSTGQNLEFDFGDMDGSYYYRVYYKATVVAGTNVRITNSAHINYDNGTVEKSDFTLKPSNGAGASVGYKKVDKTVITDDPTDQTVTYTITFTNDNAFAKDEINLKDVIDTPDGVKYVTAYGSSYFSVTYDSASHTVLIDNTTEIPASMTQVVTIVTDFSNVPVGKTISNTVGGNTVKTQKAPAGRLALTATKTVDGATPAASEVFSFVLKDASGTTLQTKQNAGGNVTFDAIYYHKADLDKTFTYTVSEADPPAGYTKDSSVYTVTVTPTLSDDENITATPTITKDGAAVSSIAFENKSATVSKTVTKTWDDQDGQDGLRPDNIQVQLYADGKAAGEPVTLTAAGGWKYTWTGLHAKASGVAIDYTVAEVSAPTGYTATVTDDGAGDAFTIVNKLKPTTPQTPSGKPTPPTPTTTTTTTTTPSSPTTTTTKASATPSSAKTTSPKTGDDSAIVLSMLLSLACAGGIIVCVGIRKRRTRKDS